jgi:RNA polymerase sigma factor (sigma-70 family)
MSSIDPSERQELDQLLQACGRGDQQGFAELYRRTSPRLFGLCLRMLRDRGAAEEVLQDTFVTVWRRASSFDAQRASALTWLASLSRHKAIDHLRRRRETPIDPLTALQSAAEDGDDYGGDPLSPPAQLQRSQDYQRLQECLDALEQRQQHSVREAFFTGATYDELARRRSVPLGTMKSWIRRGLLQLRKCLEQ